jgi:hypothetical protein
MPDRKLHSAPLKPEDEKLRFTPLKPEDEKLITRAHLCARWDGCSEKAVVRAEKRLGLQPYRILREIRYRLSDILRIEAEGSLRMPKHFSGVRPREKNELLRRERAELSRE